MVVGALEKSMHTVSHSEGRTGPLTEVTLNGSFLGASNGTGTWSRCVASVRPHWPVLRLRRDPLSVGRRGRAGALFAEVTASRGAPTRTTFHPYWAADLYPGAVMCALDLFHYSEASWGEKYLLRSALRRAETVLTISHRIGQEIESAFGIRSPIVNPFPDPTFFERPLADPPSLPRVAYWGGWHHRKRAREAFAYLASLEMGIEAVVVGPEREEVIGATTLSPLGVDELCTVVDDASVALYPSAAEGFGLPVFEALLRDRPVVVQRLDCYEEFLTFDHPAVQTFKEGDWGGMARALREAIAVSEEPHLSARDALRSTDIAFWRRALHHGLTAVGV